VKNRLLLVIVFSLAALPLLAEQKQVLSDVYPIVKKYKSMEGPAGVQTVYLGDRTKPELVWLYAIRTEVVGADGKTLMSPELMCHMNIDLDPGRHKALFNLVRLPASRLMTISQGMRVPGGGFEARLPQGFAFPIASNEPLLVMTQVLNHNIEHPKNLNVRHRVTFEYVRDADLKKRPIAVFNLPVSGMVQMGNNPLALASMPGMDMGDHQGASCLVGQRAPNAAGMASDYTDPQGHHMTGHWVVPPGRQVNTSDVTWFMNLPYDSKLHYAAVHVHPFAESLTLHDTTANKDIFKATTKNPKGRVGLDRVDEFVSLAGVPMYRDHKYELTSVYENPTKENADSMASMFLALDDPEFVAPTTAQLVERAVVITNDTAVVLRTADGDLGAMVVSNPATLRFAKMIAAGAFSNSEASVTDRAITFFEKASIDDLPKVGADENQHMPGVISLCRNDDNLVSLVIVTQPSPELNLRCTVMGRVGPGSDVIRTMIASHSGRLLKAEIFSGADMKDVHLAPAGKIAAK
jgi:hypothetical protein